METVWLKQEDLYKGYLILVNKEHGYHAQRQNLSHAGVWEGEEILYEHVANGQLHKLMEEIDGWEHIVPVSAWRSMEEQQKIWDQSLEESGREFTEKYVAVPGHSEHQTGLAIDLALKQPEIDFIRPYFPYEGICQTFRRKAAKYGFVQRYQEEKQSVTQIGHEPWHFRYVGTPHAEIMVQKGFVLEEYIAFLRRYRYGENPFLFQMKSGAGCTLSHRISYINFKSLNLKSLNPKFCEEPGGVMQVQLDGLHPYHISGNNCDGFIITEILE